MNHEDDLSTLTNQCRTLVTAVEAMNEQAGRKITGLTQGTRATRRILYFAIAGFTLVTVGLVLTGIHAANQRDEIKANAKNIEDIQDRTSDEVLCPLYAAFLRVENQPPPPQLNKQQLEQRQKSFATIHQGFEILNCNPALVK